MGCSAGTARGPLVRVLPPSLDGPFTFQIKKHPTGV